MQVLNILCVVMCILLCVSGCGNKGTSNCADNASSLVDAGVESKNAGNRDNPTMKTTVPIQKETSDSDEKPHSNQIVETALKPLEGFEFENNGNGTCIITGFGTCTDQNIVIPLESLDGDTVTLIGKYALYSLKNVNSITLVNYTYEVDENAFQYSEFTAVNIIGGSPMIIKSAFSSCEDLTSVVFADSTVETEEDAFYSCGDSAKIELTNYSLTFDDRTFQYSSLENLTITGSKVDIGYSVFSSCEDLINVTICENSKLDNEIKIDDRAFQYRKRLETVNIGNRNIEIGETVFSGCDDNLAIIVAKKNYSADAIKDVLK